MKDKLIKMDIYDFIEYRKIPSSEEETKFVQQKCETYNIVWNHNERLKKGLDHHPKAELIFKALKSSDYCFTNDYFCWKDDDNGEFLKLGLSVLFELEDALLYERNQKSWNKVYKECKNIEKK